MKKTPRDIINFHIRTKNYDDMIYIMFPRYGVQQSDRQTDRQTDEQEICKMHEFWFTGRISP